jgi:hypothetical protein
MYRTWPTLYQVAGAAILPRRFRMENPHRSALPWNLTPGPRSTSAGRRTSARAAPTRATAAGAHPAR